MTTNFTRQDCLVLPYTTSSKRKAKQFANALEEVFIYDIVTEVFRDGAEWGVAIIKGMEEINDPVSNPYIVSVVILLTHHDLVPGTSHIECLAKGSLSEIPAAQKAMTKRVRRQFRIEEKLDLILSRLGAQYACMHEPIHAEPDETVGTKAVMV